MADTLRNVLVGTSLDPQSDAVARVGKAIAERAGAALQLVHALAPVIGWGSEYAPDLAGEYVQVEQDRMREALLAQASRLGIAAASTTVELGAAHRVLVDRSVTGVDLLVVGASEGGGLARLLGSTADRVVRKAACPVLVVRGELPVPLRRVVAPVDFSPLSAEAFEAGLALLGAMGGWEQLEALFVLSVLQRQVAPQFTPGQIDQFAAQELERFVAAHAAGAKVGRKVRVGGPREEIIDELTEGKADLVVLGTHGLGGFDRLVIGSVAADVVRHAPCSVLVIPPAAMREA
jgi:nucleotide-binding universal stress UspA family protein